MGDRHCQVEGRLRSHQLLVDALPVGGATVLPFRLDVRKGEQMPDRRQRSNDRRKAVADANRLAKGDIAEAA